MKRLIVLFLILSGLVGYGQYTPSQHVPVNKGIGIAQAAPTDARSYYYDGGTFSYRPFNSTAEVLTYLNTSTKRSGNFPIYVTISGVRKMYMFLNGTADGDLKEVVMLQPSDTTRLVNIDSLQVLNDSTIRTRKNGLWTSYTIRGTGGVSQSQLNDTAAALRAAVTGSNLTVRNTGATGNGLAVSINDSTLGVKKLIAGSGVTLTAADSSITIDASGGGGGSSAAGSDQYVQVKVGSSFGAFGGFLFDYNNNRLKAPKLRLGLDHWSNERVTFTNYQEYVYGSNQTNLYDSTYNTHDEKITTIGDNLILQNFKSTQVIVGYHKLGNTSTFPTDYQHNTFTQVLGGGFLNNATNGAQVINLGSTAPNATTVSNHKFLVQGAGARTITGWSSNMKLLTEISSAGTSQNHADLNIGYLYRSGSGAGTGFIFTNKYGLYINPIKDAGITNAYGIYQEGASDLNYLGGNLYSKRYSQFGPTHWMTNGRVVAFVDDTLSGSNPTPNRAIMADRTITTLNNTTLGGNSGNAFLSTGYYKLDTNTTLTSDYQANVFSTYSAGGFLNKTGVPTQNITSGTTATNAAVVSMTKLLYQTSDSKVLTGFIGNYKSAFQISSGGSTDNFSDLILGIKVRAGSGTSHTITNHRAVHIIPIKDAATTNAFGIYQEGSSDSNYLAGSLRLPNVVLKSIDTTAFKVGVFDASGVLHKMSWPVLGSGGGGGSGMVVGDVVSGGTANSMLFVGAGGKLSQKNSDLYYDSANRYLFINNTSGPVGLRMKTASGGGYVDVRMDNDFGGDNVILRNMANTDNGKFHIVMTGSNRFTVQQNGNVGIGTSSPSTLFHVVGTSRLDGTRLAVTPVYLLAKQSDSTISQIGFPGGTTTFLNANGGFSGVSIEGTYTPSITNTTNVSSSVSNETHYQRVGDVVHVWGEFSATATSTGICEMGFSIPVSSGFTTSYDGNGTGSSDAYSVRIFADATNDRMTFRWTAPNTSATTHSFHFTYKYIAP